MPRLADVPAGGTLFLDANIFLEHLLSREPTCTAFFQRLRSRELIGVTSVVVLAEVRHRLLLTQAVRLGYVNTPHRALEVLRSRPTVLSHLKACDVGLNWLMETGLRVVSVTPVQFRMAQRLSLRYHLLTNDALHLATMRTHRLRHLASNDADFLRVPRLTVWHL